MKGWKKIMAHNNLLHNILIKIICYKIHLYIIVLFSILIPITISIPASASNNQNTPSKQNSNNTNASDTIKANILKNFGKLPVYFIQNNGQLCKKVKFYERSGGHSVLFTESGIYFSIVNNQQPVVGIQNKDNSKEACSGKYKSEIKEVSYCCDGQNDKTPPKRRAISPSARYDNNRRSTTSYSKFQAPNSELIKLSLLGSNKHPDIVPECLQQYKVNYFIGNNPDDWKTNVSTYKAVVYKEIYKGIDLRFYGNNQQMEYDIVVKPGANPHHVQFSYSGIEDLKITKDGDMKINLKNGKLVQKKPYIYQEIDGKKIEVNGDFKINTLNSNRKTPVFTYGFQVASYNKNYQLIIDPDILFSTYLGGTDDDAGNAIALDTSGNIYITGYSYSINFPTEFPYQSTYNGGKDAFITKISENGNLIYSTYLGGSGTDIGNGIAADKNGNAYVTGYTYSVDFPRYSPLFNENAGKCDVFVAKFDSSGGIVYSTYLGGSSFDIGYGIAVDKFGNAYITGRAGGPDFPTVSAIYNYSGGEFIGDAFITKIRATGKSIVYSTYLGGTNEDTGKGIAVDTAGNVYITGWTYSDDFPTKKAIDETFNGGGGLIEVEGTGDVFVTKIKRTGKGLDFSTYLGGIHDDVGECITVDKYGNVYITGRTYSDDFPTTSAIDESSNGGFDAFVTKIRASGASIIYSTYLGGNDDDEGYGISLGNSGSVYVAGYTASTDFPKVSAIYEDPIGVFITKLDTSGKNIIYSTCLGEGTGTGVTVDTYENAYITGYTSSKDFPVTTDKNISGGTDAFIVKIGDDLTSPEVISTDPKNGETGVSIDTVVTATFSEYIDGDTINTNTFMISNNVLGTVDYDTSNKTATFTPLLELNYGTQYTATITNDVKDTDGNAMKNDFTWSFTTCTAEIITLSSSKLTLAKFESEDVTVSLTGKNGCPIEGEVVTAMLTYPNDKFLWIIPNSLVTDEKGQAIFTIKANENTGEAKVKFTSNNISEILLVEVTE